MGLSLESLRSTCREANGGSFWAAVGALVALVCQAPTLVVVLLACLLASIFPYPLELCGCNFPCF